MFVDFEKLVACFYDLPKYQGRQNAIAKKNLYEFKFDSMTEL